MQKLLERFEAVIELARIYERSSSELKDEILAMGLDPTGKSVDDMEDMLGMAKWARDHPSEPFPDQYFPMLAQDATKESEEWLRTTIKDTDWWIQTKKNGMRSILSLDKGQLRMVSRDRSVKTYLQVEHQGNVLGFQGIHDPFKGKTVLDGELMSPKTSIDTGSVITASPLQAVVALVHMEPTRSLAIQQKEGSLQYNAFDILYYNGEDVRGKRYDERVAYLNKAVEELKAANPDLPITELEVTKSYADVQDVYKQQVAAGEEGIMLKKRSGTYATGKRSKELLKLKRFLTVDGWISGFTPADPKKGGKDLIGGFELSSFVDGTPKVIASVTGLPNAMKRDATIVGPDGKPALNPLYLDRVVEVIGQEWTKNGLLVHARFSEWRPDKRKEDVRLTSEDMKTRE